MAYNEDKRFQKPWHVEDRPESYRVVTANGILVAVVFFEDEKGRAEILRYPNRKQALAIANRIAKIGANAP